MRILSWNINGLPSCLKSGAFEPLRTYQADAICLQEIRTRAEPVLLEGYRHYWHHSIRDKYSGTAMLLREEPLRVHYGLTDDFDDSEGRAITAELRDFFLVNVYVPNSQQTFYRHAYRREWDAVLRAYVRDLLYDKPVVICGDFNVARESIDIYPENMRLYWAEQGYASDERSDLETLLEEGFEPERSIYLCFGHNEEIVAAEESGAGAIMETLRARGVELDSIIDEGGAMLPANVKGILEGNLAGIGIAEKGYADFRLTLKAKGGHSSQPPKHTAIGELSKAVLRLENHQFKAKLPDYVNDMFISIGKRCSYAGRLVMCNYPILKPAVKYAMTKIPPAASLIRTTIGVTMSSGSPAANVLPQSASVTVNCRIMPGESIASTKEHIRKAIKNDKIEIELIKGKEPSCISPTDSKSFRTLKKLSVAANQNNIVTPYLVMGGTDAYHYEPICKNIYRFAPFTVSTSLLLTTHSTNERCPIEQLGAGITFFKRYIREMAGKE